MKFDEIIDNGQFLKPTTFHLLIYLKLFRVSPRGYLQTAMALQRVLHALSTILLSPDLSPLPLHCDNLRSIFFLAVFKF